MYAKPGVRNEVYLQEEKLGKDTRESEAALVDEERSVHCW